MILLAWVLSLIATAYVSFHYRKLYDNLSELKSKLEAYIKPIKDQEPDSTLIDPDDVVAMARFEHEQRMKELNPELYDDET